MITKSQIIWRRTLLAIQHRGLRDLVGLPSVFFGGLASGYGLFSSHESHGEPAPKALRISWRSKNLRDSLCEAFDLDRAQGQIDCIAPEPDNKDNYQHSPDFSLQGRSVPLLCNRSSDRPSKTNQNHHPYHPTQNVNSRGAYHDLILLHKTNSSAHKSHNRADCR